jgi:hypothetical protein
MAVCAMTIRKFALTWAATATVAIALSVTAQAKSDDTFESPSGNIECWMYNTDAGVSNAGCDIDGHTYTPAIPGPGDPATRPCGGVIRFHLGGGDPAAIGCQDLTDLHAPGLSTLPYGQSRSVGTITCVSEPAGVTCTDASTGHFFRVSTESYDVG